jgi:hypothetical protein
MFHASGGAAVRVERPGAIGGSCQLYGLPETCRLFV